MMWPELAIHWFYGNGAWAFVGWDAVIESASRNERLVRPFSPEWNARYERDHLSLNRRVARLRANEPRITRGPAPSDRDTDGKCRCGCES